ncbi:hypothetical protein Cni_G25660 [Canna indica]|uniref:Uncharacterized protein n=1 Tax=Canna indica TaxID=4628 RepID=A0AAQ3KXI1_9LILI|nr:hypothetical protein Cni_G25660 [Canna indica]
MKTRLGNSPKRIGGAYPSFFPSFFCPPPTPIMYFDQEQSSPRVHSRRNHAFCFSCCFLGSPVADSEDPERPPPNAGSKRKLPSWLSTNSGLQKKKTKKTFLIDAPAKAVAKLSKATPAVEERSVCAKKSSSTSSRGGEERQRARIEPKHREPDSIRTGSKTRTYRDSARASRLGPSAGLCIMMAFLAILVFSDRAAAVVCLCCCFYVSQLMRVATTAAAAATDDRIVPREVDMDSNEYKKRVVLEGLLERNGRRLPRCDL